MAEKRIKAERVRELILRDLNGERRLYWRIRPIRWFLRWRRRVAIRREMDGWLGGAIDDAVDAIGRLCRPASR